MRAIAVLLFALLVASCGKQFEAPSDGDLADVTFFNESSYSVSVHLESFSGTPIIDRLATGDAYFTTVYPSYNHGVGSTFPIRYWYPVIDLEDCDDCWTSAIDPNSQIIHNIEPGGTYVLSIPEPKKLEGTEAFFRILNTSGLSIEFNRIGVHFRQLNGEFAVPKGQVGVYRIDAGELDEYYTISQNYETYPIPTFTAKKGYIHNFEFNGEEVILKGEEKI